MSSLTAWQNASHNALIPRERSVFATNDLSCCRSNEVTDCAPLAPHAWYTISARSKMITWLAGCHMPQKHGSADSDLLISLTSPWRWEISERVQSPGAVLLWRNQWWKNLMLDSGNAGKSDLFMFISSLTPPGKMLSCCLSLLQSHRYQMELREHRIFWYLECGTADTFTSFNLQTI